MTSSAELGYFCIPDKRTVLKEASEIEVALRSGEKIVYQCDRWETLDGITLQVFNGDELLATYEPLVWASCGGWNTGQVWPEDPEPLGEPLVTFVR